MIKPNYDRTTKEKYDSELSALFPYIKDSIYSGILGNNILKEATDGLLFGFFTGFFCSKTEVNMNSNQIEVMLASVSRKMKTSLII